MLKTKLYIIILLFITKQGLGQAVCDSLTFLSCDKNKILLSQNHKHYQKLYQKIQNINNLNAEPVNIVHIGDSHLQAGFLTEKIKQELFIHYYGQDTLASPGFIFPYTIAQTNNPFYYKVYYNGKWDYCKNVDAKKKCSLGLSGITIRTNDSTSSFSIKMQNKKYKYPVKYYFNKIKILHNNNKSVKLTINGNELINAENYSYVHLEKLTDSLTFEINNNDSSQYFELYGIILESNLSKINYHTIGVNGATVQSYLKCDYFSRHLGSLNPDLIFLSLGTNEAYASDFSKIRHKMELKDLLLQISYKSPNVPVILITPNDHYKNKQMPNPNINEVRNNIFAVSKELGLNVWDFYEIMGGESSMNEWHKKGLTGNDKIHFRKVGYEIQADLFTQAFLRFIKP